MPTWEEIKAHLHERFKIAVDNPEWIGLTWRFQDGSDTIIQGQRIELIRALGGPHLLVFSDVCPDGALEPHDMLVHNATLAVGALAITQGFFILRHVYALEGLSFPVLDTALEHIAHEAARLRQRIVPATAALGTNKP